MSEESIDTNTVELATELTIAWLSNPNTRASGEDVPAFLKKMHEAVSGLSSQAETTTAPEAASDYVPAVSVRKSVQDDQITCLECGGSFKSLKRHLRTHYNLSPEEYREKWGLPADYPMVAPNYSATRSRLAKDNGLGRKVAAD